MLFQHDFRSNPSQCRDKIYIPCQGSDQLGGSSLMAFHAPSANSCGAFQVSKAFTNIAVLKDHLYATTEEIFYSLMSSKFEIYRYDPEKNCCNQLKKPHTNLFHSCVVTDEQYIYLIGGSTSSLFGAPVSTTYRCDPSADDHEWEEVAPINKARRDACGAAMNGKVYIAGGQQGPLTLATCEVYNPVTNEWQLIPSLKIPRMSASMVCYEGTLYVLGGVNNSSRVLSVEKFNSKQSKWKEISFIPVDCFETREEKKQENKFKACSARLCKEVIDKLEPLKE